MFKNFDGSGRRSSLLSAALIAALLMGTTAPAHAAQADEPNASEMAADLVIARPAGVILTVLGSAAFVVSLPFTAAGGNMKKAAEHLVVNPARATFVRCLGCTSSGRYNDPDA